MGKPTTVILCWLTVVCGQDSLGELSQVSVGDFLSSTKEASHLCPELVDERGAGLPGRKDLFVETVVT